MFGSRALLKLQPMEHSSSNSALHWCTVIEAQKFRLVLDVWVEWTTSFLRAGGLRAVSEGPA